MIYIYRKLLFYFALFIFSIIINYWSYLDLFIDYETSFINELLHIVGFQLATTEKGILLSGIDAVAQFGWIIFILNLILLLTIEIFLLIRYKEKIDRYFKSQDLICRQDLFIFSIITVVIVVVFLMYQFDFEFVLRISSLPK